MSKNKKQITLLNKDAITRTAPKATGTLSSTSDGVSACCRRETTSSRTASGRSGLSRASAPRSRPSSTTSPKPTRSGPGPSGAISVPKRVS